MLDLGPLGLDAHQDIAGVDLAGGQKERDVHFGAASGNTFLTASGSTLTTGTSPSGTTLPPTTCPTAPIKGASVATISQPTISHSATNVSTSAASISDPGRGSADTHTNAAGADLHDALLAVLADALDDLERVRIATQNRVRSLQQVKGLEGTKFEANLAQLQDALAALEHQATLDLQRAMRLHPLAAFVKNTRGLGEKQAARLLAAIGDPSTRENPAKLWQYAGHGDPLRSRKRKGQVVEFNPTAKMRVHLCAESMLRSGNRAVYDAERAKWADRDTSDGHKHNHALRLVGKRLLLDLWKASRA